MNDNLHHIRLLAGVEIRPGSGHARVLDRKRAGELADHLAADLARTVAAVDQGLLVVAGSLLEPAEVLQPGFPVWQALAKMSRSALEQPEFSPGVMAVGAAGSRLPHPRLQPPGAPPAGAFLVVPMLLAAPPDAAEPLRSQLEAELFERASLDPPARAAIRQATGFDSVHGQLLTLADLLALQHVQIDTAGLGGFWPVIEHLLVEPENGRDFELPAGLTAHWHESEERLLVDFDSFDRMPVDADDYVLWLRALRTLTTLLDTHDVPWRVRAPAPLTLDAGGESVSEPAGNRDESDCVTVHSHPELGLVCFSVVDNGRLSHHYPLTPNAASRMEKELTGRDREVRRHRQHLCHDPDTRRLRPAPENS